MSIHSAIRSVAFSLLFLLPPTRINGWVMNWVRDWAGGCADIHLPGPNHGSMGMRLSLFCVRSLHVVSVHATMDGIKVEHASSRVGASVCVDCVLVCEIDVDVFAKPP
jgi:hypothetical protein